MRSRTAIIISVILVVLVGLGVAGYMYYTGNQKQPVTTTEQKNPTNTAPSNSENTPNQPNKQTTYPVSVYFSKRPDSDNDPSKVFPVQRTSPDIGVGNFAITELLKGPNETESANGYFNTANLRSGSVSNCSGKDFMLTISDGKATLKFCRQFDHRGVVADGQAESEINATLKQFSTIQKVVILNYQGNCEFNLSGQNLCLQ